MPVLDIKASCADKRVARLSNSIPRLFEIDLITCGSLEGLLQALKFKDREKQKTLCALSGPEAKKCGGLHSGWKTTQVLWWKDHSLMRSSPEYLKFITRVFDAVYEQDSTFARDLLAIGFEEVRYSDGKADMHETVLTEVEMIYQIDRLRFRAMREKK